MQAASAGIAAGFAALAIADKFGLINSQVAKSNICVIWNISYYLIVVLTDAGMNTIFEKFNLKNLRFEN